MNILLINCHSRASSFCSALATSYQEGAFSAGHTIKNLNLRDMNLGKYLFYGHDKKYIPEGDIAYAQELIQWSQHIVFVYPTWWAGPPALLTLFFEMVFSPGFAFSYNDSSNLQNWDKLLKGKSARLISTMDAPPWYYRWIIGNPGGKMIQRGILGFSGIHPVKTTYLGSIKLSTGKKREQWLDKVFVIGNTET